MIFFRYLVFLFIFYFLNLFSSSSPEKNTIDLKIPLFLHHYSTHQEAEEGIDAWEIVSQCFSKETKIFSQPTAGEHLDDMSEQNPLEIVLKNDFAPLEIYEITENKNDEDMCEIVSNNGSQKIYKRIEKLPFLKKKYVSCFENPFISSEYFQLV